MTPASIDLNADVGEGYDDLPLFSLVTSVNVACGVHAGDAATMERSVAAAARAGLAVGAHPGYADRETRGRRTLTLPPDELRALITEQIAALDLVARTHGVALTHVKPHGALYNQAAADASIATLVANVVGDTRKELRLVGLAGSACERAAEEAGIAFLAEGFADRAYRADGTLAERGIDGALISDPARATAQAIALADRRGISTIDGGSIAVRAATICIHGDTPGALAVAHAVRRGLEKAGYVVAAPRDG
jgi:UPF0271 protein